MTRSFAGLLVVGVGAAAVGCSSSFGTSSSEATGPPAVCSSTDALQASVVELGDVQVVENGTAALEDAVTSVKSDLQDVVDDAGSQYADQVDALQAGFDTMQTAAGAALDNPSADTLSAVTSAIRTLADDVTGFADDVASTC